MTQALVISRRGKSVRGLLLGALGPEVEVRVVDDLVAAVAEPPQEPAPRLVVVDLVDLPPSHWREVVELRARLPLAGLVAIVRERGRSLRRALRGGADALLLDPFDLAEVESTLRSALERTQSPPPDTAEAEPQEDPIEVLARFLKGLAHEVNNPLASVLGLLQLMQTEDHDPIVIKRFGTLRRELERIQATMKELELFVRVRKPRRQLLDLVPLLHGLNERSSVDLQLDLPRTRAPIQLLGDATQLETCLLRLVEVAAGGKEGKVGVSLRSSEEAVRLVIRGPADEIPDNPMDLFLPYHHAHHQGYRDSLRLAAAYGIVVGHRGDLEARREEGLLVLDLSLPVCSPETLSDG